MDTKQTKGRCYLAALIAVVLLVMIDQLSKYLAIRNLKGKSPFVILEGVFQLEYLENRGAAFGMMQGQRALFFVSVVVIVAAVLWFYLQMPMERRFFPLRIIAVFIVAGALGNCIDRIRLGYVVDFFYLKLIDFPVFNVADIYVTLSALALVLVLFFYYKEEDLERIFRRPRTGRKAD